MSENKLLDLSFEFAVAIVNLVDGVTTPKSSYMIDQLARAGTSVILHSPLQSCKMRSATYGYCRRVFRYIDM